MTKVKGELLGWTDLLLVDCDVVVVLALEGLFHLLKKEQGSFEVFVGVGSKAGHRMPINMNLKNGALAGREDCYVELPIFSQAVVLLDKCFRRDNSFVIVFVEHEGDFIGRVVLHALHLAF